MGRTYGVQQALLSQVMIKGDNSLENTWGAKKSNGPSLWGGPEGDLWKSGGKEVERLGLAKD